MMSSCKKVVILIFHQSTSLFSSFLILNPETHLNFHAYARNSAYYLTILLFRNFQSWENITIKSLLSLLTRQTNKQEQTFLTRHSSYLAGPATDVSRTEEVEPQLVWIKKHKHEVRMLHRIIQHEMHLGARLFHYDNIEGNPMLLSVPSDGTEVADRWMYPRTRLFTQRSYYPSAASDR